MRTMVTVVLGASMITLAHAQAPETRAAFAVASIKPTAPTNDEMTMLLFLPGGRVRMTNSTPRNLIKTAYRLEDHQIVGGPGWISSDRYDLDATAAMELTREQYDDRLKALLVDRFRLKSHHETREGIEYELVVGKNGLKITPSTEAGGFQGGRGRMTGKRSMTQLARFLSSVLHSPVVDRTGRTETFDITLEWTPDELVAGDNSIPNAAPSIFTAVQEQLGLRLESHKGPFLEVLVVDAIEKPSAN